MSKVVLSFFSLLIGCLAIHLVSRTLKNEIYIYDDSGVGIESMHQLIKMLSEVLGNSYSIKKIDAKSVIKGEWTKRARIFVMPGGADLPYLRKLGGLGNKVIKEFVANGGSYLGICAGSYYASSYVEFDKDGPLEVTGSRELNFFAGKAIGPILATYDYSSRKGVRAAKISTSFTDAPNLSVYYNGGGYFADADLFANTKVLAVYESGLPAIIKTNYGKGIAILSGVHFEYNPSSLDLDDEYLHNIAPVLHKSERQRLILIMHLLKILLNKED